MRYGTTGKRRRAGLAPLTPSRGTTLSLEPGAGPAGRTLAQEIVGQLDTSIAAPTDTREQTVAPPAEDELSPYL